LNRKRLAYVDVQTAHKVRNISVQAKKWKSYFSFSFIFTLFIIKAFMRIFFSRYLKKRKYISAKKWSQAEQQKKFHHIIKRKELSRKLLIENFFD
jgi:hypothetical protein